MSECTCTMREGVCPVSGVFMSPLMVETCQGKRLTPEACEVYRANWRKIKEPPPKPCRHLGEEVRRQQCDTCSGKVLLKIFACEAMGECTTQKPLPGVPCCAGCGQYSAASGLAVR